MRKLITALLITVLLFSVFSQVALVRAETSSPLTSPISSFVIAGNITYRRLGRVIAPMQRMFPAAGVTVKITEFFHHVFVGQTMTDSNGDYTFPVDPGWYEVTAKDSMNTFFVPPIRIVHVKGHSVDAPFQGLLFP